MDSNILLYLKELFIVILSALCIIFLWNNVSIFHLPGRRIVFFIMILFGSKLTVIHQKVFVCRALNFTVVAYVILVQIHLWICWCCLSYLVVLFIPFHHVYLNWIFNMHLSVWLLSFPFLVKGFVVKLFAS